MILDKGMPPRDAASCASLPTVHSAAGGDMVATGLGARVDPGALQQKMLKQRQLALERQRNIARSQFAGVAQANHQLPQTTAHSHSPSPQLRRPILGVGDDTNLGDVNKSLNKSTSSRSLLGATGASLLGTKSSLGAAAAGILGQNACHEVCADVDPTGANAEGIATHHAAEPVAAIGRIALPGSVDEILEELDGLCLVELGEENSLAYTGPAPRKLGARSPIGEEPAAKGGMLPSLPDAPAPKAATSDATASCSSCGATYMPGQRFCGNCGKQKTEADSKSRGNPFSAASGSLFGSSPTSNLKVSPRSSPKSVAPGSVDAAPSPDAKLVGNFFSDMDEVHSPHPSFAGQKAVRSEKRRRWWNPTTWRGKSAAGPMDQISEEATEIRAFGADDGPRGAARADDKVQSLEDL